MGNVSQTRRCVNNDRQKLETLAGRLYEHLDPISWKSAEVLAKELKVRKEKIKAAKDLLEAEGKIYIRYLRNGKRANPMHQITKIGNPIYKHIRLAGLSLWADLDRLNLIEMYLKSGWNVIPFRGKQPAVKSVNAWLDKHQTTYQVIDYFYTHTEMNVGMRVQGLTIIDLDSQAMPDYFFRAGTFTNTLTAKTGNGYHFYFRHDPVVRTSAKTLDQYTDTRCDGSFIVLPPSVHESGSVYSWHNVEQIRALPIEIRRLWRENDFQDEQSGTKFVMPSEIPYGTRNDTLFKHGRSLRKRGMSKAQLGLELHRVNDSRCNPTMSFSEMDRLIEHIWTYRDRTEVDGALR